MRYVALCIGFACIYGIVHDQITARVCLEYFTVWHPPLVGSQDPTIVAFAWDVVATWWVGLILGGLLAIACMAGKRPTLPIPAVLPLLGWLFLAMAASASAAGGIGYFLMPHSLARLAGYPGDNYRGFLADLCSHNASYLVGFVGGLCVVASAWKQRRHTKD